MRWFEIGLRAILAISLFGLILLYEPSALPIVELALVIIIVSGYLLATLPNPEAGDVGKKSVIIPKNWREILYSVAALLATVLFPLSYFFWPLYAYQWRIYRKEQQAWLMLLSPLVVGVLLGYPFYVSLSVTGLSILTIWVNTLVEKSQKFERDSYEEIDTLRHLNERFRHEQESLLALQDDRVHESIRQERRRIVEEIHDALGHQLSSAVIQIGALEYLVQEDEVKESLRTVKLVLNSSMENVREIIHTERQTTLNVEQELQHLVDNFTKCPINFSYNNRQAMSSQVAHSVVNIVKEALTNINKHSNASLVTLRLVDLDKQWTLLIADNGDSFDASQLEGESTSLSGIGLLNIEERINKLSGSLHINHRNGFRLFITIPVPVPILKEEELK